MRRPDNFLLDQFISFVRREKMTFEKGADLLRHYAKQRAPGYELEKAARQAKEKVRSDIASSREEHLVVRFIVKTRVRYIRWPYFPDYSVVASPEDYWWHTIYYDSPPKPPVTKNHFYLDQLYFDQERERFWMKEPYLSDVPASRKLFSRLKKLRFEWENGYYASIDPLIVEALKESRAGAPYYLVGATPKGEEFCKPPYGAKGWQERLKILPLARERSRLRR